MFWTGGTNNCSGCTWADGMSVPLPVSLLPSGTPVVEVVEVATVSASGRLGFSFALSLACDSVVKSKLAGLGPAFLGFDSFGVGDE